VALAAMKSPPTELVPTDVKAPPRRFHRPRATDGGDEAAPLAATAARPWRVRVEGRDQRRRRQGTPAWAAKAGIRAPRPPGGKLATCPCPIAPGICGRVSMACLDVPPSTTVLGNTMSDSWRVGMSVSHPDLPWLIAVLGNTLSEPRARESVPRDQPHQRPALHTSQRPGEADQRPIEARHGGGPASMGLR
jgi:hypothetical protein